MVTYIDGNLFKREKICRLSDSPICRERYIHRPGHLLAICPPVDRSRQLQAPRHRDL